MEKADIKLAWRQVIDSNATTPLEQQLFQLSFAEFTIQQQSFSKGEPLYTWSAIRERFPKSNPTLPFKISFALAGTLRSLNGQIPGLRDTLNLTTIPFLRYHFELIESDIHDQSVHKISLVYFTDTLVFFGNIGDNLLVGIDPPRTFLLKMQPELSIVYYAPAIRALPVEYIVSEAPAPSGAP